MDQEQAPQDDKRMHPRLVAKLKELKDRGLLNKAKAYVPPQDKIQEKSA